ncbi:MAG: MFS transporter [Pseudomonadales bacterium]|nr:MFS transporter [Pseudomonadales bacterium]
MKNLISKKILGSYAAVALPVGAMAMPIAIYLPPFYGEGLGLSLATVGLIFTAARIWDVVTDPLMGVLIDKYRSRWGQYKHWIAVSIPILMLAVYKLFLPGTGQVTALYLGVWLLVLYVGYTILSIAHQSWGTQLATGYDERSRLYGWREIFVISGMGLVLAIPAAVEVFGEASMASKVASMGLFCLLLFPLTVIPTLTFVPDKAEERHQRIDWLDVFQVVRANPTLWRLLAADFSTNFASSATAALYIFFATYIFELPGHASTALLLYFFAGFSAMPLWLKLAYKVGKTKAIQLAIGYGILLQSALFLVAEPENVFMFWAYTFLYGVAYGAAPALLRAMMADITDVDEIQTGKNRAGMFFALLTTVNKLGSAVAVGVVLTLADWVFGFVPGQVNSTSAISGLLMIYCFVPVLGLALAYLPLMRYPLTKAKHEEIRRTLRA